MTYQHIQQSISNHPLGNISSTSYGLDKDKYKYVKSVPEDPL
jgi:hypothetical protein